jgi:hypothetical protein
MVPPNRTVAVKSYAAKLLPFTVSSEPPERAVLYLTINVTTGESYENVASVVPICLLRVTAVAWLTRAPVGCKHEMEVPVCHDVVSHMVEPNRAVAEPSCEAKFMPLRVSVAELIVGALNGTEEMAGASYVNSESCVP